VRHSFRTKRESRLTKTITRKMAKTMTIAKTMTMVKTMTRMIKKMMTRNS